MTDTRLILIIAAMTALVIIVDGGAWKDRLCDSYDLCEIKNGN